MKPKHFKKFVVGGGGWWLVVESDFCVSFGLSQAEQQSSKQLAMYIKLLIR